MVDLKKVSISTQNTIQSIDFNRLTISEYNLKYIQKLLPHLDYYFKMYVYSLSKLTENKITKGQYIIDFGGGHGFLSLWLKNLGYKVIYCDFNPESVNTIKQISKATGFGPDFFVEGSINELLHFCHENQITPDYLISTDTIEHVPELEYFFSVLYQINPNLKMVFTTASNADNARKSKKLRKNMIKLDKNKYLPMRKEYILTHFPGLPVNELEEISIKTRGLTYPKIKNFVEEYIISGNFQPIDVDAYNTCDPEEGSWFERILTVKEYEEILSKNNFKVDFINGFYNDNRPSKLLSLAAGFLNTIIKKSGSLGRRLAPTILLKIEPKG